MKSAISDVSLVKFQLLRLTPLKTVMGPPPPGLTSLNQLWSNPCYFKIKIKIVSGLKSSLLSYNVTLQFFLMEFIYTIFIRTPQHLNYILHFLLSAKMLTCKNICLIVLQHWCACLHRQTKEWYTIWRGNKLNAGLFSQLLKSLLKTEFFLLMWLNILAFRKLRPLLFQISLYCPQ